MAEGDTRFWPSNPACPILPAVAKRRAPGFPLARRLPMPPSGSIADQAPRRRKLTHFRPRDPEQPHAVSKSRHYVFSIERARNDKRKAANGPYVTAR